MKTSTDSPRTSTGVARFSPLRFARRIQAWLTLGLATVNLFFAPKAEVRGADSQASNNTKQLQTIVESGVQKALEKFASTRLQPDQLAVSLVDLRDVSRPTHASYRGNVQIYPASVVKLFYLAAIHRWLEDGRIQETDEARRAVRDMIVDSSNEATHCVVDLLTGTTSGPELGPVEIEEWYQKRNVVNRYFTSLGYTNINVNRKPWCEGPYGREIIAFIARGIIESVDVDK